VRFQPPGAISGRPGSVSDSVFNGGGDFRVDGQPGRGVSGQGPLPRPWQVGYEPGLCAHAPEVAPEILPLALGRAFHERESSH
jgi:hypothetical protein